MNITDIIKLSEQPPLYEKGTSFMWTDDYISKQLLNIHLQENLDLGSRKKESIQVSVDWILGLNSTGRKLKILDLGCGPGLYAEKMALLGHDFTGMDISDSSIAYARVEAANKGLCISYSTANYLDADLGTEKYDLIMLIYTDFGVLDPQERSILLEKIHKALKKGGIFVFDVLKDVDIEKKTVSRSWEAGRNGFWRGDSYLALSDSFIYPDKKLILYQHLIIDADSRCEVYRFWTHFFSESDLTALLESMAFKKVQCRDDILPEGDIWNGKNVIFCAAHK